MAEIFLVRHAQASFESDDYDQLSDLGRQQALWLGEYFAERDLQFDKVVIGTQQRHRQTAECIAQKSCFTVEPEFNAGLNEYDFTDLFNALGETHASLLVDRAEGKHAFYRALKQVLVLWQSDQLTGKLKERWSDFYERVRSSLDSIQQSGARRVLIVSSGGPIAALVTMALKVEPAVSIELNMQVVNSSLTRLYFNRETLSLGSFNTIAHLDLPARIHAITYG